MAKTRRELDLTRNTIRRMESIQKKLLDSSSQWEETDNFIASSIEQFSSAAYDIISEIKQFRKA